VLYTCLSVDAVRSASYVGQTMRHLCTRVSEHLGLTPITGQPSSSPVMFSIFSHLNTTGHSANFDDFKILSSCSDTCELLIHESLLISKINRCLLKNTTRLKWSLTCILSYKNFGDFPHTHVTKENAQ
jgi:hypothetical protein